MKTLKLLYVIALIFSNTVITTPFLTPTNTIIISDIDDVLIQKSFFLNSISLLKNLIGNDKKNDDTIKKSLTDKKENHIHGLTFHLLYNGMIRPFLTPYTSWMVHHFESSRSIISETQKIYEYLKTKGYTIIFATNKDRIAYDITAQSLGNSFTDIASKVFIAHPKNDPQLISQLQAFADLTTTPQSYKDLLKKTLSIQPTEMIFHVPGKKPDFHYYDYLEKNLDADKNMVFIDDKLRNTQGFQELQKNSLAQRIGIVFKNAQQLAQDFVDLGILSEVDDQQFLKEIRYPGIWGKIQLIGTQLITQLS